ncbi:hypothetical protein FC831_15270 [Clostridium botulinum]|nr:hypothetical protein [Clostridium botulinum]
MITIQTYKIEKSTGNATYKDYRHTNGSISLTMEQIQEDKNNNDLNKYEPIVIYNIFDDIED